MATAIRIKLVDLLKILNEHPPSGAFVRTITRTGPLVERDVEVIRRHLQSGPTERKVLEIELGLSRSAITHRLNLLKERGVVVECPGHCFALGEGIQ
jgi:hypothetical protein